MTSLWSIYPPCCMVNNWYCVRFKAVRNWSVEMLCVFSFMTLWISANIINSCVKKIQLPCYIASITRSTRLLLDSLAASDAKFQPFLCIFFTPFILLEQKIIFLPCRTKDPFSKKPQSISITVNNDFCLLYTWRAL